MMRDDYIQKIALEIIIEQQAKTKINSDRDTLLYLMAFNDGVMELALALQNKLLKTRMRNEEE